MTLNAIYHQCIGLTHLLEKAQTYDNTLSLKNDIANLIIQFNQFQKSPIAKSPFLLSHIKPAIHSLRERYIGQIQALRQEIFPLLFSVKIPYLDLPLVFTTPTLRLKLDPNHIIFSSELLNPPPKIWQIPEDFFHAELDDDPIHHIDNDDDSDDFASCLKSIPLKNLTPVFSCGPYICKS